MYGVDATSRDFSNGIAPIPSEAALVAREQYEKALARHNDVDHRSKGRSAVMQAATERGGPAKYRSKLKKALNSDKYYSANRNEQGTIAANNLFRISDL